MRRRINAGIIKTYNKLISVRFLNKNTKFFRRVRAMLFHNICYECLASFGKQNLDRKFYLIRCPQSEMGLWAVINYVIFHIEKAIELNREPVVDWQFYPNNYFSEDDEVGKINVWECFFEQTSEVTLDEVYRSYDVLMSNGDWDADNSDLSDGDFRKRKHYLVEKYLHLNVDMQDELALRKQELGFDKYKILGVKCRGTDFIASKPKYHAMVPDNNTTITTIEKYIDEWNGFDKIFVCTEDKSILEELKSYFGEKLIYLDINRVTLNENVWLSDVFDKQKTKIRDMKDYLIETYLLASCGSLIAPRVGGTIGAVRIRGNFDNMYIFTIGTY